MDVQIQCGHCGKNKTVTMSAYGRANRDGRPLFCGRGCAGIARRSGKDTETKRAEKAAYDAARRIALKDEIKAAKREYYQRTRDPQKEAAARKIRMPAHVEYCRRPEYREWKRQYDRDYRAREYGEYADCFLLVMDIRREALSQATDYEIRQAAGTLGKSQQRKREYDRTNRNKPEIGTVGHAELPKGGQYAASRG